MNRPPAWVTLCFLLSQECPEAQVLLMLDLGMWWGNSYDTAGVSTIHHMLIPSISLQFRQLLSNCRRALLLIFGVATPTMKAFPECTDWGWGWTAWDSGRSRSKHNFQTVWRGVALDSAVVVKRVPQETHFCSSLPRTQNCAMTAHPSPPTTENLEIFLPPFPGFGLLFYLQPSAPLRN